MPLHSAKAAHAAHAAAVSGDLEPPLTLPRKGEERESTRRLSDPLSEMASTLKPLQGQMAGIPVLSILWLYYLAAGVVVWGTVRMEPAQSCA